MAVANGIFNESMNLEKNRLFTYKTWPSSAPISAEKLAKAGFYYTGSGLEVVCFSCNGKLNNWFYGDQAFEKHRKTFPFCQFVLGKSNNQPFFSTHGSFLHMKQCEFVNNQVFDKCKSYHPIKVHQEYVSSPVSYQNDTRNSRISSADGPLEFLVHLESARLGTFSNWPITYIDKNLLAAAGFYYLGFDDKVQCAFCRGILGMWESNDIPIEEHRKHFPFCQFLQGVNVGNVPITEHTKGASEPLYNMSEELWHDETGSVPFEQLGVISNVPKHPAFATYERRLATFNNWPRNTVTQIPEKLAEAGFVYAGFADNVKCFFCDGGLRNWEPNDDPWVEHARWFSACGYLRLSKGEEFIEQIRAAFPQDSQFTLPSASPQHRPPIMVSQSHNLTQYSSFQTPSQPSISELDQEMASPIVQSVLGLGFDLEDVRKVVATKLRLTGCGFNLAENLVSSLLESAQNNSSAESAQEVTNLLPTSSQCTSLNLEAKTSQFPSPSSPLSLEEEYQMLKDQRMCKICMDHEVAVVFLPCGHLISCVACASALRECPICRKIIRGTVRTYLS